MDDISAVDVRTLAMDVNALDAQRAAELYREYGCLVVRGLMRPYVD